MSEYIEQETSALEYIKSLTLLCVEDNKTTQLIYDSIFEDIVKEIHFADNGEDGYQKYLDNDIDIIISDYDMPVLNGLDMIEKIRKVDKTIPIVLVSAIEDIDVILRALNLSVNNFIKKPIQKTEVIDNLISVSKVLIADNYLKEQREKKISELEAKEEYSYYQEELAFQKELNILRNDFYYKMGSSTKVDSITLVDFLYQPLDIVSGDAYSARNINDTKNFFLVVDGMGKGLSASLSAMLLTAFINNTIDNMMKDNSFDFKEAIRSSLEYIKPILLDEEALAIDYVLIDYEKDNMSYAKFAMPVTLLEDKNRDIHRIKSNNPPLSKYHGDFNISTYDTSDIVKFLIYSDGLVENITKEKDALYMSYIEDDFKHSFTKDEFKHKIFDRIDDQEDDITLIFINKLNFSDIRHIAKEFPTRLNAIDDANEWYTLLWEDFSSDAKLNYKANVVFTELYMNAYEHGNLHLLPEDKNIFMQNDTYFDTLIDREKDCEKNITIDIHKIEYDSYMYIITQITDEGDGFDTQILSTIFRNSQTFNGRGVFVSRQSSLGIYYNDKGNSVLYLHKIEIEK